MPWVGPVAAVFVGCVSVIIFRVVRGVITKFLCFAIDQDLVVDRDSKDGRQAGSEEQDADPVVSVDPETPIVPGVTLRELPLEATITIDEDGRGSCGDIDLEDGTGVDDDRFDDRFYDVALDPESDTEVRVVETLDEDAQDRPKRRRFKFIS
mmetsp:Transcript_3236/g.7025  ORF Transcript_3236/g.7025 Transcript_3236/m.7025 type:complete len:152 (+) Transcript_3236:1037-1492(+)